jgi:hypothetical protein
MDSRLQDLHTAMPCEVRKFDATKQTVDVQPLIKNVVVDGTGSEIVERYPLIRSVPVCWPRCGDFVVVFPLAVGDVVTVVFHEWSIDRYLESGREEAPADLERHGLSGAAAYPGGPYPAAATVGETIDGLIIGNDGGAVIRIKDDGTIEIGASASTKQPVALADDVKDRLDTLASDLNTLKGIFNSWVVVAQDGGAALKTLATAPGGWASSTISLSEVGSSKVEVEE